MFSVPGRMLQSANPRANNTMRTMLPSLSAAYCVAHVGRDPGTSGEEAHALATLPMRMGGIAFSCVLCSFRFLGFMGSFHADDSPAHPRRGQVEPRGSLDGCLEELREAAAELDARAFGGSPVGRNFATGSDRHRTTHVTQANGRTVGIIGHPLSPTPITGGSQC